MTIFLAASLSDQIVGRPREKFCRSNLETFFVTTNEEYRSEKMVFDCTLLDKHIVISGGVAYILLDVEVLPPL